MARSSLRNVLVTGPVLQGMFFVTATRVDLPFEVFYLLFLAMIATQLVFLLVLDPQNPGLLRIRKGSDDWKAEALKPQVLVGVGFGIAVGSLFLAFGSWRGVTANDVVTQVLFVGFVETLFLIVTVETTPHGYYAFPPLFGFAHEPVREAWIAGQFTAESFVFFAYATAFGILFMVLYAARDPRFLDLGTWNEGFGAVTTWTTHVVVNLMIVAFLLEVLGFPLRVLCIACGG